MLWNVPSAFMMGVLFTTFISWIVFPEKVSEGGLVPDKVAYAPVFSGEQPAAGACLMHRQLQAALNTSSIHPLRCPKPDMVCTRCLPAETAFSLSFNWAGHVGKLTGALVTFLCEQPAACPGCGEHATGVLQACDSCFAPHVSGQLPPQRRAPCLPLADLDFLGSAITFCSLGQMAGILSKDGDIPRSNIAFMADAFASMMGGLLGSSGEPSQPGSAVAPLGACTCHARAAQTTQPKSACPLSERPVCLLCLACAALTTYVESSAGMKEGGRTGEARCPCCSNGCSILTVLHASVLASPVSPACPGPSMAPCSCCSKALPPLSPPSSSLRPPSSRRCLARSLR